MTIYRAKQKKKEPLNKSLLDPARQWGDPGSCLFFPCRSIFNFKGENLVWCYCLLTNIKKPTQEVGGIISHLLQLFPFLSEAERKGGGNKRKKERQKVALSGHLFLQSPGFVGVRVSMGGWVWQRQVVPRCMNKRLTSDSFIPLLLFLFPPLKYQTGGCASASRVIVLLKLHGCSCSSSARRRTLSHSATNSSTVSNERDSPTFAKRISSRANDLALNSAEW